MFTIHNQRACLLFSVLTVCLIINTASAADLRSHVRFSKGYALLEGDIILDKEDGFQQKAQQPALHFFGKPWKNGFVPYEFSEDISDRAKKIILDGMKAWSDAVPSLQFRKREKDTNYLKFVTTDDASICGSSYIGMRPGLGQGQDVRFNPQFITLSCAIHELGHALGLPHEHTRSDRDEHVRIRFENISDSAKHNFEIREHWADYGPYDIRSIMHYDAYAFSTGSFVLTIEPKSCSAGQYETLTTSLNQIECDPHSADRTVSGSCKTKRKSASDRAPSAEGSIQDCVRDLLEMGYSQRPTAKDILAITCAYNPNLQSTNECRGKKIPREKIPLRN